MKSCFVCFFFPSSYNLIEDSREYFNLWIMFHNLCCMRSILTYVVVTIWYTGSGSAWCGLKFSFEVFWRTLHRPLEVFLVFIPTLQEFSVLLPGELSPVMPFCYCTSYVWEIIHFLHSSTYSAMSWTFCKQCWQHITVSGPAEQGSQHQGLSCPTSEEAQGAGRPHNQGSRSIGIFSLTWCCA